MKNDDIDRAIEAVREAEGRLFELKARLQSRSPMSIDHELLREADVDDSDKTRINIILTDKDMKLLEVIMQEHGVSNRSAMLRYLIRLYSRNEKVHP
jgi:hypothetical protein